MSEHRSIASAGVAALLVLAGCSSSGSSPAAAASPDSGTRGDAPADSATGTTPCEGGSTLKLANANNYDFTGSLDIKPYPLAEFSDVVIDWSGLTKDLQGHDLNPATDLNYTGLIVLNNLTEQEVEQRLSTNTLDQSYITAYLSVNLSGNTSVHLSDYTVFGNDIGITTYFKQGYGVWLLTLATGTTPGVGTRMAAFLEPDPTATSTQLSIGNDSTKLSFTVDLQSLQKLSVPAATTSLTTDWSGITLKGDGSKFEATDVDEVMLAHYASMTVAELQERFLDIEQLADDEWTASVTSGTTSPFTDLDSSKGAFTGITDQGVWLLALRCTTCANPAPPFVTVLQTCP